MERAEGAGASPASIVRRVVYVETVRLFFVFFFKESARQSSYGPPNITDKIVAVAAPAQQKSAGGPFWLD